MTEEEWLACGDSDEMLRLLGPGEGRRKFRLYAVACCRRVLHLLDVGQVRPEAERQLSRSALDAAERFADGEIDAPSLDLAAGAAHLGNNFNLVLQALYPVSVGCRYAQPRLTEMACQFAAKGHAPLVREFTANAAYAAGNSDEPIAQAALLRDIFGNPFRPVTFAPEWRTDTAVALARQMYESRDFGAMPILADALQDAGCDNDAVLTHCREAAAPHVRGCWVVDLVLGLS